MKAATLAAALRIFASELERLEEAEAVERRGWTAHNDEHHLGERRFIARVKRGIADGDPNYTRAGRNYSMSPGALAAFRLELSKRPAREAKPTVAAPVTSMVARLEGARRSAR